MAIIAVLVFFSPSSTLAADTISVKLVNYLGNKTEVSLKTNGSYKLENSNTRFSGSDRFEVAYNVASSQWNKADTVVIVNYEAFADALSATPLAYKLNAPILLVKPNELPAKTNQKLNELDPKQIIIIGGKNSISSSVETQLKSIASVERIDGNDRFQVSQNISNELGVTGKAILTNGYVFSDALSIAPYAAKNQMPILLTKNNELPSYTKQALQNKEDITIIGGEVSVTKNVQNQLGSAFSDRIGGSDRYEVSANIINELNLDASEVYLSNGEKFADALTGSVVAALQNKPLLLTKASVLPDPIKSIISAKSTKSFVLLGGPVSITTSVENQLPNALYLGENTTYTVKVSSGRIGLYQGSDKIKDFGSAAFTISPSSYSQENVIAVNGREYLGKMEFGIENSKYVRPINKNIPFEDYLKGVVPHEMPTYFAGEALKAQAVAARTYSASSIGKTVVDSQAYQVYGGYEWYSITNNAIEATKGQVLKYNDRLISAVFSSSNGGQVESNSNAWGTAQVPYLITKQDSYDEEYTWDYIISKYQIKLSDDEVKNPGKWWASKKETEEATIAKMKKWIIEKYYPNAEIKISLINDIKVGDKNSSGRAKNVIFSLDYFVKEGSNYTRKVEDITIPAETVRSLFGTMEIRSTLINNIDYKNYQHVLKGSGFGHGVGLSQHGANNRAAAGQTYQEILNFYYPYTKLTSY